MLHPYELAPRAVIASDKLEVQKNIDMTLRYLHLHLSEPAAEHVIASATKQSILIIELNKRDCFASSQ